MGAAAATNDDGDGDDDHMNVDGSAGTTEHTALGDIMQVLKVLRSQKRCLFKLRLKKPRIRRLKTKLFTRHVDCLSRRKRRLTDPESPIVFPIGENDAWHFSISENIFHLF